MKRTIYAYGLAIALSLSISATADAQARPKPPSSICLDGKCTPDVSVGGGLKWNPGHYMLTDPGVSTTTQIGHIQQLATRASGVKGAQVRIYWGEIETAKNVYNWACIDSFLNALKAVNKRLVIQIMDRRFASTSNNIRAGCTGKAFPQYLIDEGHVDYGTYANAGSMVKTWEVAAMDRYIALLKAILNRYDDEDKFEMISTEEINPGLHSKTPTPTYSNAALATQWKRMMAEVSAARRRTLLNVYTNSLSGQLDGTGKIFEAARQYGWATGGPDIIPDDPTPGDNVRVGNKEAPDNLCCGLKDYRGLAPAAQAVQSASLGGRKGAFTGAQLAARAKELGIQHVFWLRLTWNAGNSTDAQYWGDGVTSGILKYLNENPNVLDSRCPSSLAEEFGGCQTGG